MRRPEKDVETRPKRCGLSRPSLKAQRAPCGDEAGAQSEKGGIAPGGVQADGRSDQPMHRHPQQEYQHRHVDGISPHERAERPRGAFDECQQQKERDKDQKVFQQAPRKAQAQTGGQQIRLEGSAKCDGRQCRIQKRHKHRGPRRGRQQPPFRGHDVNIARS